MDNELIKEIETLKKEAITSIPEERKAWFKEIFAKIKVKEKRKAVFKSLAFIIFFLLSCLFFYLYARFLVYSEKWRS